MEYLFIVKIVLECIYKAYLIDAICQIQNYQTCILIFHILQLLLQKSHVLIVVKEVVVKW